MNIPILNHLCEFSHSAYFVLKDKVLFHLTDQQKKILIIASFAFGFLAICYATNHFYFKRVVKLTLPNGNLFEGEFKYSCGPHGFGKITYPDGRIFEGEFKTGKRHGNGKITYPDKRFFEGEFKDDEANGRGKITYSNGAFFEAEYKDGKANRSGTLTMPNKTPLIETISFVSSYKQEFGTVRRLDATQEKIFYVRNNSIIS